MQLPRYVLLVFTHLVTYQLDSLALHGVLGTMVCPPPAQQGRCLEVDRHSQHKLPGSMLKVKLFLIVVRG